MKKHIIAAVSICLAAGVLVGCNQSGSSQETTTETESVSDAVGVNAGKYVKLGTYKDLTIESVKAEEITDEKITEAMKEYAGDYLEYSEVTDRDTVEKDDTIEADLKCTIDGVVDPNYEGEDIQIEIGAGNFTWVQDIELDIDDKLIGAKIGDTVKVDFEYSLDYEYDNLAGKKGTLEITIKRIMADQLPDITDAWVQDNMGVDTVDEWKQQLKEELEAEAEDLAAEETNDKMWEEIEKNAQQIKEFPENIVQDQVEQYEDFISENAAYEDMDEAEYRELYLDGLTVEEFSRQELFVQCVKSLIAQEEGLTVTDEELQEYLESYSSGDDSESTEDLMELFGGEDAIKTALLNEKVEDFLKTANTFE